MNILSFDHICIQTNNYDESVKFYCDILGCEVLRESKGFHGRAYNTWLKIGTAKIELQTPKEDEMFIPWNKHNAGPVHIAIVVDDVESWYRHIKDANYHNFKEKNGEELYAPVKNGTNIFKVKAPEGTEIEVRQRVGG